MSRRASVQAGLQRRSLSVALPALVLAVAMTACGGDGGGPAAVPAAVVVSGVTATGAAFAGSVVTVVDARGVVVGTSPVVGANGAFSITLAAGAQAPFVLTATRTSAEGDVETLVSVLATATTSTVNVTSVTTLVASRLSPSGNPLALAAEVKATPTVVDAAKVAAKVAEVKEILAPVLAATGTTAADPIGGTFATDGTGQDRLLDTLTIAITPASATSANVEVGIKRTVADGAQPPVIQFNSAATIAQIKTDNAAVINAAIPSTDLVPVGTNVRIQQLLTRVSACYALPLATRIETGGTTAAAIKATECRSLFLNDDPATFLSNGSRVGASGSFDSLYRNEATGVVFDQGAYEFTRTNGDLVIAYHTRGVQGAETNGTLAVRLVGTDLKVVGNGYAYPGGVVPYHQHRQFVTKAQSAYDYRSTGYVTDVFNVTANGVPVFDRVEVVTPDGQQVVLKPSAQSGFLVLQKAGGGNTETSYIRLRSQFDATTTAGTPAATDSPSLFFVQNERTEAQIAAIPAQSSWTFKYYLASAPATLAATQHYKTQARALTLAEFRAQPLAKLTATTLAALDAKSNDNAVIPLAGGPFDGLSWEVPAGAIAPTQLTAYGVFGVDRIGFNDERAVTTIARSGSVACSIATVADVHCVGSSGAYAAGSFATGLHLKARDRNGRDFVSFYATYRVPVAR